MIIEWAMIALAGALAASILWLIALPLLARRTARRATARLLAQMPMSMAAINADKDALRAGHAADTRRLEQAAEATQQRLAAQMAENGRHIARIVVLEREGDLARDAIAALTGSLATAERARREAEATLGTQVVLLHDALGLSERRGELLAATEARLGAMDTENEQRRATIAGLETRATGEDLRQRAALARAARLAEDLSQARTAMDDTSSALQVARADAALATRERDALKARVEQLVASLASLESDREAARNAVMRTEQRLRLQASTIDGLSDRVMAQDAERDALHRLLDEAHARRDALQAERARLMAGHETGLTAEAPGVDDPTEQPAPDESDEARAARLRLAVAALAADLVSFATRAPGGEAAGPSDAPL